VEGGKGGGEGRWDGLAILGGTKACHSDCNLLEPEDTQTVPFTVIKKETEKVQIRGKKKKKQVFLILF